MPKKTTPTQEAYGELSKAYDHFNAALFGGRLPPCLFTFQRRKGTYGFFAGSRWTGRGELVDEIAMNPTHFNTRPLLDVLSTLVHEQVHSKQHHFGRPSRSGYHNRQWAEWMLDVGLVPSDTGEPGGKQTGQRMTHYIETGGRFEIAARALLDNGFRITWRDRAGEDEAKKKGKSGSRVKYICPGCAAAVWGKADLRLACMECEVELEADD